MAQPIVDGLKEQLGDEINIIHLNLLGSIGRQAARTYGVSIVPATLLFNGSGKLLMREVGMPNQARLTTEFNRSQE